MLFTSAIKQEKLITCISACSDGVAELRLEGGQRPQAAGVGEVEQTPQLHQRVLNGCPA